MKELIIDRKTWYRGKGPYGSVLLKGDGSKCCLGFFALSKGIEEKSILGITSPVHLASEEDRAKVKELLKQDEVVFGGVTTINNDLCQDLVNTNDNEDLTEAQREAKITKLFKKIDVNVSFIN